MTPRRLLWFVLFLLGLPAAFLLLTLVLFLHDIPRLMWGILYEVSIPEPGWPIAWWLHYCAAQGRA